MHNTFISAQMEERQRCEDKLEIKAIMIKIQKFIYSLNIRENLTVYNKNNDYI